MPLSNKNEGNLNGKSFLITGSLKTFTLQEAKLQIEKLGGTIKSTVSRKLNFVIIGNNPGSKHKKAIKYKLKIIKEAEFLDLIQHNSINKMWFLFFQSNLLLN